MGNPEARDDSIGATVKNHWPLWFENLLAASLGAIIFVIGFGWDLRRLAAPLGHGDILQPYVTAKFWGDASPFGNNTLGYPFGMDLRYFPTADVAQNVVAGIIAGSSRNPFLGINAVHALSFPIVAIAALWVFRIVGVRGPIAIVASLALTAIPYHWLRLEHFYLGTMYSAVIGVGLALLIGSGEIERRLSDKRRRGSIALFAFLALVVAISGIYYACFTILLCTVALVYRFAHDTSWRGLLLSATPIVAVIVMIGAALAPAFLFVRANPALQPVANRSVIESVMYSGNLAFLLTPAPFTSVPGLESLNSHVQSAYATAAGSGQSSVVWFADFGSSFTVAALAFALLGFLVTLRRRADGHLESEIQAGRSTQDQVSFGLVATLLAAGILFYIPWGLNVIFAALVTAQIRGWDRLTPVLLTLFFVGAMVAWRMLRLPQTSRPALVVSGVLLALLIPDSVIGYRPTNAAASAIGAEDYRMGKEYATVLNRAIPGDCAILQLPYQPYPESAFLNQLSAYDHFWAPLTNPEKRWTFGATKGTFDSAWLQALGSNVDSSSVASLTSGGFCGIHVDGRGYTTEEAAVVESNLAVLLGSPVATGHNGDWIAWKLPDLPGRLLSPAQVKGLPRNAVNFFYSAVA